MTRTRRTHTIISAVSVVFGVWVIQETNNPSEKNVAKYSRDSRRSKVVPRQSAEEIRAFDADLKADLAVQGR